MSAVILGSVHLDRDTGRLLIDGQPVCTGCGKPSATRFCGHVCEVKHSAELAHLRQRMLPIRLWALMPERFRAVGAVLHDQPEEVRRG